MSGMPFRIVLRQGSPPIPTGEELRTAELIWDDIAKRLGVGQGTVNALWFPALNVTTGGIAPGKDTPPDDGVSVDASEGSVIFKEGSLTTGGLSGYSSEEHGTGFYFPNGNFALVVGDEVKVLATDNDVQVKVELVAEAGLSVTGTSTSDDFVLRAVDKVVDEDNTITAVFIYECRRDWDAGIWRDRVGHTSWFSETEGATRGSRNEFPSIAVIVATPTELRIYDGDDVTLPLWMTFEISALYHITAAVTCLYAKNGSIYVGTDTGGLSIIDFIRDETWLYRSTYRARFSLPISKRNSDNIIQQESGSSALSIGSNSVLKVVAEYFMSSDIDPRTGMPLPTCDVLTEDAGIKRILPNDAVVTVRSGSNLYEDLAVSPDGTIYATNITENRVDMWRANDSLIESVVSYVYYNDWTYALRLPDFTYTENAKIAAGVGKFFVGVDYSSSNVQLWTMLDDLVFPGLGLLAITGPDYISGFLPGDCRLAALCNGYTADRSVSAAKTITHTGTVLEQIWGEINYYEGWSSSNYITVAASSNLNLGTSEFSLLFHFRESATAAEENLFEFNSTPTAAYGYRCYIEATTSLLCFEFTSNGTTKTLKTLAAVDDDNFGIVAIVYRENDRFELWLNGTLQDTETVPSGYLGVENTSALFRIGCRINTTLPFANGSLALLRVARSALSPYQIEQIVDYERDIFQNADLAWTIGTGATEVRNVDFDLETDNIALATDVGIMLFNGLQRVETVVVGSSNNLPSNNIRDISTRYGSYLASTPAGTWISFPSIFLRGEANKNLRGRKAEGWGFGGARGRNTFNGAFTAVVDRANLWKTVGTIPIRDNETKFCTVKVSVYDYEFIRTGSINVIGYVMKDLKITKNRSGVITVEETGTSSTLADSNVIDIRWIIDSEHSMVLVQSKSAATPVEPNPPSPPPPPTPVDPPDPVDPPVETDPSYAITFFTNDDLTGSSVTFYGDVRDLRGYSANGVADWDNRAKSMRVVGRWQVWKDLYWDSSYGEIPHTRAIFTAGDYNGAALQGNLLYKEITSARKLPAGDGNPGRDPPDLWVPTFWYNQWDGGYATWMGGSIGGGIETGDWIIDASPVFTEIIKREPNSN
jgi:hypothetical protein